MTTQRKITIGVLAVMLVCALIIVIGNIGSRNHVADRMVQAATATVTPYGVTLDVSGSHASCDRIGSWNQVRQGNLIVVTPVSVRLPDASCDDVVPFEEIVAIAVGDLPADTYRIDVGGVVVKATLDQPIIDFDFAVLSDATFNRFAVTPQSVTKADLNAATFPSDVAINELEMAWSQVTAPTFADRMAVLSLPCATGASCRQYFVVDMGSGGLVRSFESSYGIRAQQGSALFIVNDPAQIVARATDTTAVAEAYVFDTNSRQFDFVAQGDYVFGQLNN